MDYITKNINSFTKRLAEAINGRQINAPKANHLKLKQRGIGEVSLLPTEQLKYVSHLDLKAL